MRAHTSFRHISARARINYGMNNRQYSFQELNKKTVVNVADGKELGNTCDLIFNACGAITGIVVPGKKSIFKSITNPDSIFIPYNRIIKIGQDIVLVEIAGGFVGTMSESPDSTSDDKQN